MPGWFKRGEKITGEAARRITGISLPFGGISWADAGPSDASKVQDFLLFLEDRRVLYNPDFLEVTSQVHRSIHEIREQCTKTLQGLPQGAFAVQPIRTIRSAGRRFHDDQGQAFRYFDGHHFHDRHRDAREEQGSPGFFAALGAFRSTVGYQVALLAAHYDLSVEGDLAAVLPDLNEEE